MKNIKALIIFPVVSFMALVSVSSLFASNVGRSVYGILTENYNGVHYKAAASDADAVDMQFWDGTMGSKELDTNPPEGSKFVRFTLGSQSWAGGGVSATNTAGYKDMSAYYGGSIKFLARVSDSRALNFTVGLKMNGSDCLPKTLSQLGLVADGEWHELTFNLTSATNSNITASNLAKTNILFQFAQTTSVVEGLTIDVDNIRWVKSTAGSFSADLKNIGTDTSATTITWSESVFRNGWKVANQYIDFDLDLDLPLNWNIRIYTDNGSGDKAGLVATSNGRTFVLPMAWRVDKKAIPYDDGYDAQGHQLKATFDIAEQIYQVGDEYKGRLYDNGVANPNPEYNPWFYFVDSVDKDKVVPADNVDNVDYTTVWNCKGFHSAAGGNNYWGMSDMNSNGKVIAPKLYFAAGFNSAAGGVTYVGNILIELKYE